MTILHCRLILNSILFVNSKVDITFLLNITKSAQELARRITFCCLQDIYIRGGGIIVYSKDNISDVFIMYLMLIIIHFPLSKIPYLLFLILHS